MGFETCVIGLRAAVGISRVAVRHDDDHGRRQLSRVQIVHDVIRIAFVASVGDPQPSTLVTADSVMQIEDRISLTCRIPRRPVDRNGLHSVVRVGYMTETSTCPWGMVLLLASKPWGGTGRFAGAADTGLGSARDARGKNRGEPCAWRTTGCHVQTRIPASAEVTLPASRPMSETVEPMIWAIVRSALLRFSPGKLWCSSPRRRPPALPMKRTGHSVFVCVFPQAVSDVT